MLAIASQKKRLARYSGRGLGNERYYVLDSSRSEWNLILSSEYTFLWSSPSIARFVGMQ